MDEVSAARTLVRVVECGSLSAAARSLNLSVPSVARQINSLEARLGVRLFNRTTRQQSLTAAGALYHERMVDLLRGLDAVRQEVRAFQTEATGKLNIHLRTSIGAQIVLPALPAFLAAHPLVSLDLTLTDERANLVERGVDVAVWLGGLDDSSLVARRLSSGERIVCASADYLARNGAPRSPGDLIDHNCLIFDDPRYGSPWSFRAGDDIQKIDVAGNMRSNSSVVLLESVARGVGIAILQSYLVSDHLVRGDVVRVLPGYELHDAGSDAVVNLVYPSKRQLSAAARAFIDYIVTLFEHGAAERSSDRMADDE